MEQMYKGIPFSPQTMLTTNISASDTVIPVSDALVFPTAPNYATIGTDEQAETVLYNAIAGNNLSGCVRGIEGTAKAWLADELISRNFTNQDYDKIISNVQELESDTSDHLENLLPHILKDDTQKSFKYGFKVDDAGSLVFVYEEVV